MLDERCEMNNAMLEENCAVLGYHIASVGTLLRTFRFYIS
jgi:hypothetical protein